MKKVQNKISLEDPNVVLRKWEIDTSHPSVQLVGNQYKFNKELIFTKQIQIKDAFESLVKL